VRIRSQEVFSMRGSGSEIPETRIFSQFPAFSALRALYRCLGIAFMDRVKRRGRGSREYEYQRTYKACIPCSRRKVKCEAGDNERCRRCTKKNINCTFTTKKPWSRDQNCSPETVTPEITGRDGPNKYVGSGSRDGCG
jgi:hypothetical protein